MKKHILLFLTVALTAIIFIHSSMSAEISTAESDTALGILERLLQLVHIPSFFTSASIRKAAHFVQFAAFGTLLTCTSVAYCGRIKPQIFRILFFMLAVPVTDEFIQYFSVGRSSQVSDVLLDFSGCITGLLLVIAILAVIHRLHNSKERKTMKTG